MRASSLTAIAALAASVIATPLESRQTLATWPGTNVKTHVAHIVYRVEFNLTAPAGYVEGAPEFDVYCDVMAFVDDGIATCAFNGPQAEGSQVVADYSSYSYMKVTHTFGSSKAEGVSEALQYNKDFTVAVTSVGSA